MNTATLNKTRKMIGPVDQELTPGAAALNAIGGVIPEEEVREHQRAVEAHWLATHPRPQPVNRNLWRRFRYWLRGYDPDEAYQVALWNWFTQKPLWIVHEPFGGKDDGLLYMNDYVGHRIPKEAVQKIEALRSYGVLDGPRPVRVLAFGTDPLLMVHVEGHWHFIHVWDE